MKQVDDKPVAATPMVTLDMGCGKKKQEAGAVGVDRQPGSAADVIADLARFPWPFHDGCADRIYLSHFVEHQQDILRVMAEVHRVARSGAEVLIVTPHFSSPDSYTDPTHHFHLGYHSFDYFTGQKFSDFTYNFGGFEILDRRLEFGSNFLMDNLGRMVAGISIDFYEKHFAWIFPGRNLYCRLRVVK